MKDETPVNLTVLRLRYEKTVQVKQKKALDY